MRVIVKVRKVGDTLVITIPKEMAEEVELVKGDRVMLSSHLGIQIVVTKGERVENRGT